MKHRSTRRRFLRASSALLTAPTIVPSSALGRDGAIPPSERIGMGFVGLGTQGRGHLFGGAWTYLPGGYLGQKDVQVLGVCDVQRRRSEAAQRRVNQHYADRAGRVQYAACRAYDDIREMVLDPSIDAVLIAAAYHGAATNSLIALHAGKDVYCEKPTSVTVRDGRAVVEAVKRYGRVYQGGTQQRSEYGGRFRRVVELVRSGRIGRLQRVYSYQGGGGIQPPPSVSPTGKIPPHVDWEAYVNCLAWFNYDGNTGAHRFGTGEINWGQHHLDIAQWGANVDESGPEQIRLENGKPVFHFANGVQIHGCPPPGGGWQPGGATFVGTDGQITVHRDVLISDPPELVRSTPTPNRARVYSASSHSRNFLECIRTRQPTMCGAESTHRAASLLLLGGIAMKLGRSLRWDPVDEIFPNEPEANRMLSMPARPPWRYS